ncbi:MAG: hypothetical protein SGPRY_013077 [Prymnesium sp.]
MVVYERLACYLVIEHKISDGQGNSDSLLSSNVAVKYLCLPLSTAAARFKAMGSDSTKLFCTCLDVNASIDASPWLRALKKKMIRIIFERSKENG